MGKKLKRHLPIDGQIAKLSSRGLIIEDEDYARRIQKLDITKYDNMFARSTGDPCSAAYYFRDLLAHQEKEGNCQR